MAIDTEQKRRAMIGVGDFDFASYSPGTIDSAPERGQQTFQFIQSGGGGGGGAGTWVRNMILSISTTRRPVR